MTSKELVKTRFWSTGHGVQLEGSMSYAKGRDLGHSFCLYKSSVGEAVVTRGVGSSLLDFGSHLREVFN